MKNTIDVNLLKVASPCPTSWESMRGDERIRFCSLCQKNVYNLAELTQAEIDKLIGENDNGFCGRLARRADGTVITNDCPVGLNLIRQRWRRLTIAASTFLSVFFGSQALGDDKNNNDSSQSGRETKPTAHSPITLGALRQPSQNLQEAPPEFDGALSFEDAAFKSECIVLAEYEGYEKGAAGGWNHPVLAHYHIYDVPKGPPLNKDIPIKYEFHDIVHKDVPAGWKFAEDKMPEKGSKWILFIEFAGLKLWEGNRTFQTFQGSYGRQPATAENLNRLDSLLYKNNMHNTRS